MSLKVTGSSAMRAVFGTSAFNNLPDFGTFYLLAQTVEGVTSNKAVEYAPLITSAQRTAYETLVNSSIANYTDGGSVMKGYAKLGIWERPSSGTTAAGNTAGTVYANSSRPYFFPAFFLSPFTGNQGVFNYDLNSEPTRSAALTTMLATQGPCVTALIYLVQDVVPRPASLIFTPIFSGGTGISNALNGTIVGAINRCGSAPLAGEGGKGGGG